MTAPTIELLPCPFCSGDARFIKRQIGIHGTMGSDWWHSVQCMKCNAAVGYDDNRYRDRMDALKAWNTRPQSPNTLPLDEVPDGWRLEQLAFYKNSAGKDLWICDLSQIGTSTGISTNALPSPAEALRAAIAKAREA